MRRMTLLLAGLLLMLVGCDRIEPGRTVTEPVVLHDLATLKVVPVLVPARSLLQGTVESVDRGVLTARIAGQVDRILVHEGQSVAQGELLLSLSGETATADLRAAQAAAEAAERQLAEAAAKDQLARQTFERYAMLHTSGAITPLEYDQAEANRAEAAERLAAARASVEASRARLRAARIMADQARLKAPYPARVTDVLVDTGSTVLPGTPLLLLDRSGPWLVRVALPETLAGQVAPGDQFEVEIPALDQTLPATLQEMLPAADPASRTVTVKLRLADSPNLKAGLFAKVRPPKQQEVSSVLVPEDAIITRGQLTAVYVVESDILHYRLVRTGPVIDSQVEILSGLSGGETIITSGLEKARHGARLEPSP